jgi:diaminopropionate ammonia-lyase
VAVIDDQVRAALVELDEEGIATGPCGAATLAGLRAALADEAFELPADAVVVLINTEGPTQGV